MWELLIVVCLTHAYGMTYNSTGHHRPVNPQVWMNVGSYFLRKSIQNYCYDKIKTFLLYVGATEIISYWGYPNEDYNVVTEDGFILGINRIPHGKMKSDNSAVRPVVFLQHGLLASATSWISNLPNNSSAFILADAGYDVWLGNSRGNTYSRKHLYLSPDSKEFWSFSFDEIAKYDLLASINFVLKKTRQEQIYYSQGTLTAFLAFSNFPKLAQRIKTYFALAPAFYAGHTRGLLRVLAQVPSILYKRILAPQEVFPQTILKQVAATKLCNCYIMDVICGKINFAMVGFDPQGLNMSRIDVYLSQNLAGSSLHDILHTIQAIQDYNVLRAYDFGSFAQNMKHYKQPNPPCYSVKNLKVRPAVWYGLEDLLADPRDVENLLPQIPNLIHARMLPSYDHLDFVFGYRAPWDIYYEIIAIMKNTI